MSYFKSCSVEINYYGRLCEVFYKKISTSTEAYFVDRSRLEYFIFQPNINIAFNLVLQKVRNRYITSNISKRISKHGK